MIKLYGMVFLLCMSFFAVASGDVIVLKDLNKKIDFRVLGATDEYVSVEIPKRNMKFLNMQFSQNDYFSDVIFLDTEEITLECKVKEIKKDEIIILIPTFAISSIQMSFKENGDSQSLSDENSHGSNIPEIEKKGDEKKRQRAYRAQSQAGDLQKEELSALADELRTEVTGKSNSKKYYRFKTKEALEKEDVGLKGEASVDKNERVDFEISNDTGPKRISEEKSFLINGNKEGKLPYAEAPEEASALQDPNLGSVEGRILKSGKPLKDCLVQLRRLEKCGLLLREYRLVEGALELETVTNEDGYYHFMNVSPGDYKLYWKSPSETTWVRRFKMEPDVIVDSGKTVKPRDIEILKRTLN